MGHMRGVNPPTSQGWVWRVTIVASQFPTKHQESFSPLYSGETLTFTVCQARSFDAMFAWAVVQQFRVPWIGIPGFLFIYLFLYFF